MTSKQDKLATRCRPKAYTHAQTDSARCLEVNKGCVISYIILHQYRGSEVRLFVYDNRETNLLKSLMNLYIINGSKKLSSRPRSRKMTPVSSAEERPSSSQFEV